MAQSLLFALSSGLYLWFFGSLRENLVAKPGRTPPPNRLERK